MATNKGCGTCRDRRILCDRTRPSCLHCSRSYRKCQGYGLRLSWPKQNDGKRSLVGKAPSDRMRRYGLSDARLVNVTSFDMEMYRHLSSPMAHCAMQQSCVPLTMGWSPVELDSGRRELLHYFQNTASRSLRTLGHESTHVGNILMRMAMSNDSPSGKAVLQSLLALSSLHRYGIQPQAANLRISALGALATAARGVIGVNEAKQHVAAGMLLYSLEVIDVTCKSSQWTWYIAGVKDVVQAASVETSDYDNDFATLLDWVYYHDILARFSLLHYRGRKPYKTTPSGGFIYSDFCIKAPLQISHKKPSPFAILEHLLEVCETVATKPLDSSSGQGLQNYNNFLRVLQWRIKRIPITSTTMDDSDPDTTIMMELFKLATLIYLERASGNTLSPDKSQQWIHRAFTIFSQLNSCEQLLPLLLLGCEARTDDERIIILDLIARSEERNLLKCTQYMIEGIWAQDDLAEKDLDYVDKLATVLSSCTVMMTFV